MPEAKKISELPVLSSVQPNDILPIVNEALTQTSKCTAGQIAAIGGGPPGINTVAAIHLQDGAVTAPKVGFTGPDKIITRTASGAGGGVEVPCTSYARGLLAAADGPSARTYLNALQSTDNPVFTGQVQVGRGSVVSPAIAPSAAPATGVFFPEEGVVSFATTGFELFRMANDGLLLTPISGIDGLRPNAGARAWVNFNGVAAAGQTFSITANAGAVARRYGRSTHVIGDTPETKTYMESVEDARGLNLVLPTSPQFADSKGRGTFPRYNLGSETRYNYTSPGDNFHWIRSNNAWSLVNATGRGWIGTIVLNAKTTSNPIRAAVNVSSIERTGIGVYKVSFEEDMHDENYCVVAACANVNVSVINTTAFSFTLNCFNINGAAVDPTHVYAAVFR